MKILISKQSATIQETAETLLDLYKAIGSITLDQIVGSYNIVVSIKPVE